MSARRFFSQKQPRINRCARASQKTRGRLLWAQQDHETQNRQIVLRREQTWNRTMTLELRQSFLGFFRHHSNNFLVYIGDEFWGSLLLFLLEELKCDVKGSIWFYHQKKEKQEGPRKCFTSWLSWRLQPILDWFVSCQSETTWAKLINAGTFSFAPKEKKIEMESIWSLSYDVLVRVEFTRKELKKKVCRLNQYCSWESRCVSSIWWSRILHFAQYNFASTLGCLSVQRSQNCKWLDGPITHWKRDQTGSVTRWTEIVFIAFPTYKEKSMRNRWKFNLEKQRGAVGAGQKEQNGGDGGQPI